MRPLKSCSKFPFSAKASRFMISSLMLPLSSSCCLWPGATRRIRRGVIRAILLHCFCVDAAVFAFAACIARLRACSQTAAYLRSSPLGIHWIVCSRRSASILERRCNKCSWLVLVWDSGGLDATADDVTVGPVALVTGALPISLAWQSVQRCRWQVSHVWIQERFVRVLTNARSHPLPEQFLP